MILNISRLYVNKLVNSVTCLLTLYKASVVSHREDLVINLCEYTTVDRIPEFGKKKRKKKKTYV